MNVFFFCSKTFFVSLFIMIFSYLSAVEFKIGVLYWSMNIPGQVAMRNGLESEVKNINKKAEQLHSPKIKLETRVAGDGDAGIERQIRQMYELINQKVDLIIVQPTDNAALSEPLKAANKAGIPVVAYDQYITGGRLTAYRTSDNYNAGFLNGEYISSLYNDKYEIKIILIEYPKVSSTVERVNGFLDALGNLKQKYKIISSYVAVEPVGGYEAGGQILRDFPKSGSVDVIFAVNDGGGLAIVKRLLKAERREIKFATIDGDPESVNYIRNKEIVVIDSAQFCGPLGAESVKAAYDILNGQKVAYHALVPVFPITKETIKSYPGWLGPIPDEFQKPWFSNDKIWKSELRIVRD